MATLTSSGSFNVAGQTAQTAQTAVTMVLPAPSFPNGKGRLVHPTLGVFDYSTTPDEWTNMDGDVIVMPTYAASKSLQGASVALWKGDMRDVICEERWLALGGASMPVSQLRMLLACAMNPVDPSVAYMQWYPNYNNPNGYNVLLLDVVIGSGGSPTMASMNGFKGQGVTLTDLVNIQSAKGGWVDKPVTVFWKMISKVSV